MKQLHAAGLTLSAFFVIGLFIVSLLVGQAQSDPPVAPTLSASDAPIVNLDSSASVQPVNPDQQIEFGARGGGGPLMCVADVNNPNARGVVYYEIGDWFNMLLPSHYGCRQRLSGNVWQREGREVNLIA